MLSKVSTYILCIAVLLGTLMGYISPALALAAGMVSGIFKIANDDFVQKSKKFQKLLLQLSVVGLGFGIHMQQAVEVGSNSFFITLITIVCTFIIAFAIGKILKSERITTILVASGTAICGGSAIAAVSPSLKADSSQTSISLAIVFLLNAIALFIFPYIGHYFGLDQSQFGTWSAIAIHDTSSVVGAAEVYGNEALNIATTTKLVRTLWIIPLVLIISFGSNSKERFAFPWFIFGFIGAMLISSYVPEAGQVSESIVWIARKALIFTLFLIGMQINIAQLKKLGFNILIVGITTWIVLGAISLFYVLNYL
ncbi:YeiH family protein [Flagellimonas meridianipacifica]|uniref:Putative integral membrane protein (TIGR00698 family) n=1 Tax=Flagellimonas meridianipacifica TaxID=1080225 RepID=A0A2T0MFZ2_9FLAO|nr:putative sulfate exporter family transporter [Allomuricauda pacifica]PRX56489.1 putative integral membrane protein (TIGR00698 family) [Allomuricauda pacifica]